MNAIFARRFVASASSSSSSSQITNLLTKHQPTVYRRSQSQSQSRHFLSHLLPSGFSSPSSSSSATRFIPSLLTRSEKIHGFFFAGSNTLRNNNNLKLKFGNFIESRAGFGSGGDAFTGFKKRGWKSWIHGGDGVVFGLIIANAAVFAMWKVSDTHWMNDNFVFSLSSLKTGSIHTMVTSGFSHIGYSQILFNMVGLYYFGTRIARTLGPISLLKLYFAGTLGGCVFFLSEYALMKTLKSYGFIDEVGSKHNELGHRGAQGAVFSMILVDAFLFPKVTTYFELMIRVPAMMGVVFFGDEVLMMLSGEVDSLSADSTHVGGGAMAAAIMWRLITKGRFGY